MKGDFSRITFDPTKHYSRVLMQQGRVQLDADWNEQVAIILHRLETMAEDLIGPLGGGPRDKGGFEIESAGDDFKISKGRYYVGGMLCENDDNKYTYKKQLLGEPDFELDTDYLVYLDAWEQYVTVLDDPNIREKALGGADTAGRSSIVWSVRTQELKFPDKTLSQPVWIKENWEKLIAPVISPPNRGMLKVAREQSHHDNDSPCIVSPTSRFRGLENQLYRIEIHSGGEASSKEVSRKDGATFKWSRENGSVILPVASAVGQKITLDSLSGYSTTGLKVGDWVELMEKAHTESTKPGRLLQITAIGQAKFEITVNEPVQTGRTYLRRWESAETKIFEDDRLFTLEDGIQIRFQASQPQNKYRTGDYWCIPARTADEGTILGPKDPAPPDGVIHHYSPLGSLRKHALGKLNVIPCTVKFDPMIMIGK